jgi:hypothetical protein
MHAAVRDSIQYDVLPDPECPRITIADICAS